VGVVRVADDRGEGPVDVQEHGGAQGIGADRLQSLFERERGGHPSSMARAVRR
jgi:hypothetical protein